MSPLTIEQAKSDLRQWRKLHRWLGKCRDMRNEALKLADTLRDPPPASRSATKPNGVHRRNDSVAA